MTKSQKEQNVKTWKKMAIFFVAFLGLISLISKPERPGLGKNIKVHAFADCVIAAGKHSNVIESDVYGCANK